MFSKLVITIFPIAHEGHMSHGWGLTWVVGDYWDDEYAVIDSIISLSICLRRVSRDEARATDNESENRLKSQWKKC